MLLVSNKKVRWRKELRLGRAKNRNEVGAKVGARTTSDFLSIHRVILRLYIQQGEAYRNEGDADLFTFVIPNGVKNI